MRRNLLLLFAILLVLKSQAIEPPGFPNAINSALGNAGITHHNFWSALNYSQNLAYQEKFMIGSSYQNKLGVKELKTVTIGAVIPLENSGLGIGISQFGFSEYKETNLHLGYGKSLSEVLSIGVGLNYFKLSQAGINQNLIYAEIGISYKINNELTFGIHLSNPNLIQTKDSILSERYQVGFGYQVQKNIHLYADVSYNSKDQAQVHTGLEILRKDFAIRMGYSSLSNQLSFGFGYQRKNLVIGFSTSLHQDLGFSPTISLAYAL